MTERPPFPPRYAELHAHSAFSFLDGASQPEELAAEAARLGLEALALTDHDGLYGVVRFSQAAKAVGMPTVFGSELHLPAPDGRRHPHETTRATPGLPVLDLPTGVPDPRASHLLVLARGPDGYRALSRSIAEAHLRTQEKGAADYRLEELAANAAGQWLVLTGCRKGSVRRALAGGDPSGVAGVVPGGPEAARAELDRLVALFGRDNVAVEVTASADPYDSERADALAVLAADAGLPLVATGNVHYATPRDADLAAALAAVRARTSVEELDGWLPAAPVAHLRSATEMLALHRRHPSAVGTAAALAAECAFDLSLVAPQLPPYPVPDGHTEATWLRELVRQGALELYGPPDAERVPGAYAQLEHELRVIEDLGFPGYFLVVYDLVKFCRDHGILAQGRGSAANSAVCYALRVTAVDAVRHGLLFERFLAPERDGPPDIDVDIESARREEVIQYVFAKHGRSHAAQVANVISYRPRSAIRDAARALGYDAGQQDAWAKSIERWGSLRPPQPPSSPPTDRSPDRAAAVATVRDERRRAKASMWGSTYEPPPVLTRVTAPARSPKGTEVPGMATSDGHDVVPALLPPAASDLDEIPEHVVDLADRFLRLPRHLGIHSGGMVMCDRPVIEVCPVEWARMPGRTVLQWDKEDCADAGLVKFDLLGLGMLTALRLAFTDVEKHEGQTLDLHALPAEDPRVYDLLSAADTVGVFQVESRAQMGTLPRLQPRTFYDIVIEVALIRPGPIQGNSVHPYIERAHGRQAVTYLHPLLEKSLAKTKGVPLFQEQLMQMAIDVADFTPAEADQLRRAMGSKRSTERMEALKGRLMSGMATHGIGPDVGEQIYEKLRAFADFGFPESHAYSFAFLVYASAWLKVYHPAAFYAGLLAAQPMGFYSPQSLAADARRHGIEILRPDVQASDVQACVERTGPTPPGGEPLLVPAPSGTGPAVAVGVRTGTDAPVPRSLAVRLGLASVRSVGEDVAQRLVDERRAHGPFADLRDLVRRVRLSTAQLEALATAGALDSLGGTRREALWAAGALAQEGPDTLPGVSVGVAAPMLPGLSDVEAATADVWATGVSVDSYPTQFVREGLDAAGVLRVVDAYSHETGRRVAVAGVVTHRQRPGTAGGVTFLSLEDETGLLNIVCSAGLWQRFRRVARTSRALVVRGRLERSDGATNLVAEHLGVLSLKVRTTSRDFR
ncbi:error-prone DNA polymerase [Cellulomonas fimi]|uniref:Error-prone DNA polymerase n=1 Tax=Cellulomonas fimi (strain ATCC 484 / DSM 20113 / JCM 1341 / CCUG 24087 / LMG 16345 / NBRC 15513 / NCIMB 8980 / NCTC 7547 / NRS-133) TaxID=590998 RepID=F4H8I9_CELFA|nr:error-prone DNA polymerase [Cellulomonas fimi]AEE45870.1 DNA polymerase III, alpha subunit [Cellulomonas fimi ATCC 484]NNH06804.1 error-prone DNA polymerase [Cellulomonas fimi]VEH30845.1 DNA polymerase III subunit alpha [Cellulomonas fimi]